MNKQWLIKDVDSFAHFIHEIEQCTLKAIRKEPYFITLAPVEETKITAHQRKQYWTWLHEWYEASGSTKESTHLAFKEMFLINIYCCGERSEFFIRMRKKLRWLRDIQHPDYDQLKKRFLVEDVSITDASYDEMAEYLKLIKDYLFSEFNFTLTTPYMKGLLDHVDRSS